MAKGINNVTLAGNVSGNIKFGATRLGESAGSFLLAVDGPRASNTVWLRCNVYGELADRCRDRLSKGAYVTIAGELMTRVAPQTQSDLVEVRCLDIVFRTPEESHGKVE